MSVWPFTKSLPTPVVEYLLLGFPLPKTKQSNLFPFRTLFPQEQFCCFLTTLEGEVGSKLRRGSVMKGVGCGYPQS